MMEAGGYSRLLGFAAKWERPVFPVKGGDLAGTRRGQGAEDGRHAAARWKSAWVDSGFALERGALLERAAESLKAAT